MMFCTCVECSQQWVCHTHEVECLLLGWWGGADSSCAKSPECISARTEAWQPLFECCSSWWCGPVFTACSATADLSGWPIDLCSFIHVASGLPVCPHICGRTVLASNLVHHTSSHLRGNWVLRWTRSFLEGQNWVLMSGFFWWFRCAPDIRDGDNYSGVAFLSWMVSGSRSTSMAHPS